MNDTAPLYNVWFNDHIGYFMAVEEDDAFEEEFFFLVSSARPQADAGAIWKKYAAGDTMKFYVVIQHGSAGYGQSHSIAHIVLDDERPRTDMTTSVRGPFSSFREARNVFLEY